MAQFRKKPAVIVAHRVGDDGWPDAIWEGVNQNKIVLHLETVNKHTTGHVDIKTLAGVMRARIGDYVIKDVDGTFSRCHPDIFEATYEEA
jgi:hypothetical protein